jgi:hypothetical protein
MLMDFTFENNRSCNPLFGGVGVVVGYGKRQTSACFCAKLIRAARNTRIFERGVSSSGVNLR